MTRPQYETAADRTREGKVAAAFATAFKDVVVSKLPYGDRADFLLTQRGIDAAYIEIKTRTCTSKTYATYHVSKDKLEALRDKAAADSLAPVLVVQWKDRIGFINVNEYLAAATFKQGGRWDRNDPYDVEEMAEVAIDKFQFLP